MGLLCLEWAIADSDWRTLPLYIMYIINDYEYPDGFHYFAGLGDYLADHVISTLESGKLWSISHLQIRSQKWWIDSSGWLIYLLGGI